MTDVKSALLYDVICVCELVRVESKSSQVNLSQVESVV
jgi:hypothetical protein